MKKYFLGLFSLVLAICFNLLQSNTMIDKENGPTIQTPLNWYPVDEDDEIESTTPLFQNMTKSQVLAVSDCQDLVAPNCLYGTNGSVTVGQNIESQPADQRILRSF